MRSKYRLIILAAFAVFAFGISAAAQSTLVNGKVPKDLLITFERTPCYGTCPDYTLTINAKGSVKFHGGSFTKVKGTRTSKLTNAKLRSIIQKFDAAMFSSLKDAYDNPAVCGMMVTDLPNKKFSLRALGITKNVFREGGCIGTDASKPELKRLDELADFIDQITNSIRWTAGK